MTHSLTSIVAVGLKGEIGVKNSLPWRLKSDLRFFKQTTLNNIVIMGRKTFNSIGGCLKGRDNIVLSHRATLFESHEGCEHAHSIAETLYLRKKTPRKEAYIIGGAQTYTQFAPFVDRYLITIVNSRFADADAFFSEEVIGDDKTWVSRSLQVERAENGDEFDFTVVELTHRNPEMVREARRKMIADFEDKNHFLKRKSIFKNAQPGMKLDQILSIA